jgi:DNA-binding transcriptional LysR family regulator
MAHAPRLPLNTLTAFRAVAELQNLRAAAEALHLTHSAVSQQIRGLEEQLGFQLFDRRGRRIVLNPAGQALLRSAQGALALLDDGVQAAAAASAAAQQLRVTVVPSFANRWLLPRIGRWREQNLARTRDRCSIRAIDLQREGFHAGLRQGLGPWAGLQSDRLFGEPPMIVVGSPRRRDDCTAQPRRWRESRCSASRYLEGLVRRRRSQHERAPRRGVQRRRSHAAGGGANLGSRSRARSLLRTR